MQQILMMMWGAPDAPERLSASGCGSAPGAANVAWNARGPVAAAAASATALAKRSSAFT